MSCELENIYVNKQGGRERKKTDLSISHLLFYIKLLQENLTCYFVMTFPGINSWNKYICKGGGVLRAQNGKSITAFA